VTPLPGLGSSFNEPETDDTTSAPPETVPSGPANAIAQLLAKKKKKPFGTNVKNPGALAGAIARAKKAHQTGQKWG
jgi:hypothetical protein